MSDKKLTEKQKIFLEVFLDASKKGLPERDCGRLAKQAAGYSENTSVSDVVTDDMIHLIIADANKRLALNLHKALNRVDEVMDNPEAKGAANQLAAATAWLDRGGVTKKESKEITIKSPSGIVVLPPKAPLDEQE